MTENSHFDVIVLGGGPAGLTAAIYLSRARLRTLVLTEGTPGGQMTLTHEIANYPGIEKINGYMLGAVMKKQAASFGAVVKGNVEISSFDLEGATKSVTTADGQTYSSDAMILAPGGRSRALGVSDEDTFRGRGISYCATCDGDFFTGKEIVVVGGGNSALGEAVSLTNYATRVTVVHQFDHFQAFEYAVEEAKANSKISFIMSSTIDSFYGNEKLEGVKIRNLLTGDVSDFTTDGVFIFIGYVPNTESLEGLVSLNERGEIITGPDMSTNIEGVYAAGDAAVKRYRQVTTAVADGTVAALAAADYLHSLKRK
ncbi:MAG: FAD-dependent oxidoreductase [Bacteroidales bacterium]|nr:FAD-dependent oxidoreductase [Bacteroidales bacterium]MDT8374626.1 FAD-dependent oxidoreductase [Bacteroidales bacterium]